MNQNSTQKPQNLQQPAPKRPNDTGSISVEGHVRIFDPNNKEIFVEKRA